MKIRGSIIGFCSIVVVAIILLLCLGKRKSSETAVGVSGETNIIPSVASTPRQTVGASVPSPAPKPLSVAGTKVLNPVPLQPECPFFGVELRYFS